MAKGLNINSNIKFKFTSDGMEILKNIYTDFIENYPENKGNVDVMKSFIPSEGVFNLPAVDKYGYIKMPLWQFIECWGKYIQIDQPLPIESYILIKKNDFFDKNNKHIEADKEEYFGFDINNNIKVKFNEKGFMILDSWFEALSQYCETEEELSDIKKIFTPSIDKSGYAVFPMWQLMSVFSPHMKTDYKIPFEFTLIFSENSLHKVAYKLVEEESDEALLDKPASLETVPKDTTQNKVVDTQNITKTKINKKKKLQKEELEKQTPAKRVKPQMEQSLIDEMNECLNKKSIKNSKKPLEKSM